MNVNNFILSTGEFDQENSPNKISSNTFLQEISQTHPKSDKINPKQRGYYYYDEKTENISISFEENEICLYASRPSDPEHNLSFYYVKYEFDQRLDLIIYAKEVTFKFTEKFANLNRNDVKLNLTISIYEPEVNLAYQLKWGSWSDSRLLAKEEVKINYEGNWR